MLAFVVLLLYWWLFGRFAKINLYLIQTQKDEGQEEEEKNEVLMRSRRLNDMIR